MSLPQAYVRQRDDYLKYLRQFLPWVNISSLALIAYRPQDLLRPPSAKHNFFSRIIREGLSPEENQLGVLLASKNEPLWRTKKVPKRNGGTRVLHIPNVLLKHLQRATLFLLEKDNRLKYHRCATAFRPTNSVLANAKHHSRPGTLIRLDIRNFFPSITADRIASLLKSKHVHPRLASLQAALMTHKGRLPQGAPSSPPLSNAVCSAMDDKLNRFAMAHKLRYTRYADDMVFSSKRVLTRAEAREIVFQARMRVAAYGFRINLKKTSVMFRHHRQLVTGVVVNEKPQPPRPFRKLIRAVIHNCKRNGILEAARKYSNKAGPIRTELVGPPFAAWRAAQRGDENARKVLTKSLGLRRRIGRYADYDRIRRYLPAQFRSYIEPLSETDRYNVIDFWLHVNGLIGYLAQFDRVKASQYRDALMSSSLEPTRPPIEVPEIERQNREQWDLILDKMGDVNDLAGRLGRKPIFAIKGNPPRLPDKRLVAENEDLFSQFILKAHIHFIEVSRSGLQLLPEKFREGKIVPNDIRLLRNYYVHPPDERNLERAGDIFRRYTGHVSLDHDDARGYLEFQRAILSKMQEWVGDIAEFLQSGC